jgi:hypothetical protein
MSAPISDPGAHHTHPGAHARPDAADTDTGADARPDAADTDARTNARPDANANLYPDTGSDGSFA